MENNSFEQQLEELWKERVETQFLYHGMSKRDLTDPLDPGKDPFAEKHSQLFKLIKVLQQALAKGFQFKVHEGYSGMSFRLSDILNWSKRDLKDKGIDFTSSPEDGLGYSLNYQGSQLKQNFKYITDNLPGRKNDEFLASCMTEHCWSVVAELNSWLREGEDDKKRVIVQVSCSAPIFDNCHGSLPIGSLKVFSRNIIDTLNKKKHPLTIETAVGLLPGGDFCYRIEQPLHLDEFVKIKEV